MTKEECLEALDTIGLFVHVSDPINGLAVSEADLLIKELINEYFELKKKYEKASDKATPKKGIVSFSEISECTVYECPICGGDSIFMCNYCSDCGQRLDWKK